MAIATIGTQLFALVSVDSSRKTKKILEIDCFTGFNPGEDSSNRLQTTCIKSGTHTYIEGVVTPGEGSLNIDLDPNKHKSHRDLFDMYKGRTPDRKNAIKWAVGFPDGEGDPVLNDTMDDWELPVTRTWGIFEATVATFPYDFELDEVIKSEIEINRSGDSDLIWRETDENGEYPKQYTLTITDSLGFVIDIGGELTSTIASDASSAEIESAIDDLGMAFGATVTRETDAQEDVDQVFTVVLEQPKGNMKAIGAIVS